MKSKVLLLFFCLISFGWMNAQNVMVNSAVGQNPNTLINQRLAGPGVILSNGQFNGSAGNISSAQIGTFSYTGTNFPFQSGLVMTTGNVSVAQGPNSSGSHSSTTGVVTYQDNLLSPYTTNIVTSSASLDFDFVAFADTFAFSYIFGSEEYPEYACSSYNDVFAFLLTGPDPVTGATTTKNVAIIPNTITAANPNGIPVAINTINAGPGTNGSASNCTTGYHSDYYQNNPSGAQGVQYDGYTVELSAQASVLACSEYHMHLGVANVMDNAFDSGVFLKEGSFYSPTMEIIKDYNLDPEQQFFGDTVVQNCRELDILLQLPRPVNTGNYHCDIEFLGDAVLGQDYVLVRDGLPMSMVENSFYFAQNTSAISMHLSMLPTATCDNGQVKTVMLIFNTIFCDDYYYAGYEDAGRSDTLYFYLKCNDIIQISDQVFAACHQCDQVFVEKESGEDDLLWQWIPETGLVNPDVQNPQATIENNTTYQVIAKDRYDCLADTATVEVTINEQPVVDLRITPDGGCVPLSVTLNTLGMPDNCQIAWNISYGDSTVFEDNEHNPVMLLLDSIGSYDVSLWLSTAPGCNDSIVVNNAIQVYGYPTANFTFSPEEANNGETVYFTDASIGDNIVSYHWNFGDGGTSTLQNPEHAYHISSSDNMLVRFVVTNDGGCSDDTTQFVPVVDNFALYVPNSFTPNNDNLNDFFLPKVTDVAYYKLEIYDRNGNLFFLTEDTNMSWDGTINGKPAPIGVYSWVIYYIRYSNVNRTLMKRGTVTLLR